MKTLKIISLAACLILAANQASADPQCPDVPTPALPQGKPDFKALDADAPTKLVGDVSQLGQQIMQEVKDPITGAIKFAVNDFAAIPEQYRKNFIDLGSGKVRVVDTYHLKCLEYTKTLFEGPVEKLVDFLNEGEAYYNNKGYSLRNGRDISMQKIPTDVQNLRNQILNEVQLKASELLGSIKDPLWGASCPRIPTETLPAQILKKPIQLPDGTRLEMDDFLARLNDTQSVLCSIGHSILSDLTPSDLANPQNLVNDLLQRRDRLFNELGLPKFARVLNLQAFDKIGSFQDIEEGIAAVEKAVQSVGPEMLHDLKKQLGVNLPDTIIPGISVPKIEIPAMPSFPIPAAPKRTPLVGEKKKLWQGISLGKRDTLGLEGHAALIVAGTEVTQTVRAEADANAYIFNNEINILSGTGDFKVGPEGVESVMSLYFLGQTAIEPKPEKHSVKLVKEDPNLLKFNFDKGYSQTFTIGPVPVSVKVGAYARLSLGYRVGLINTRIDAAVVPQVSAGGYAEASIGIAGFLCAGAGAELTVINLNAPIAGFAQIMFDPEGYPFLRVGIDSDTDLTMLKGKIYAFAEYPVPFWIAKSTFTIWEFQGPRVNHKIMSWGMDIGHKGVVLKGDILDQADQEQAKLLQDVVNLDNRAEALHEYERKLIALADNVGKSMMNDLQSAANEDLRNFSALVQEFEKTVDEDLKALNDRVNSIPMQ